MFTNLLPNSYSLFSVTFSDYARSHYLKRFQKDYPGRKWEMTELSIKEDLARLRMPNNETQKSQQIDELKHIGNFWIAKYYFKIAGTNVSTKDSGNRCIFAIDIDKELIEILLIYHKNDLPKNQKETSYIESIVKKYSSIDFF